MFVLCFLCHKYQKRLKIKKKKKVSHSRIDLVASAWICILDFFLNHIAVSTNYIRIPSVGFVISLLQFWGIEHFSLKIEWDNLNSRQFILFYMWIRVCVCICVYICVYVCMYECLYVFVCVCTHIFALIYCLYLLTQDIWVQSFQTTGFNYFLLHGNLLLSNLCSGNSFWSLVL